MHENVENSGMLIGLFVGRQPWRTPKLFDRLNCESKLKIVEGYEVRVRSLTRNIWGVEGRVGASGWGLGWITSRSIIHTNLHKPNNKLIGA